MFQIRPKTFETNSSSTHSLTIFTPEEWSSFGSDPDMFIDRYGEILSRTAAIKEYRSEFCLEDHEEVTEDDLSEHGYFTFREITRGWGNVLYEETPSGHVAVSIYHCE